MKRVYGSEKMSGRKRASLMMSANAHLLIFVRFYIALIKFHAASSVKHTQATMKIVQSRNWHDDTSW